LQHFTTYHLCLCTSGTGRRCVMWTDPRPSPWGCRGRPVDAAAM